MAKHRYRPLDRTVGYTVLEISTHTDDLYCWTDDPQQQRQVLEQAQNAGITYLPMRQGRQIVGLVQRDAMTIDKVIPITADWLIAADTPILHLIELFAQNPDRVFLVLQSSQIVGLVAPADLNKVPARASLYLLTAQFESELAQLVRRELCEDEAELAKLLSDRRIQMLHDEHDKTRKGNLELNLFYHLYLADLFTIISKHPRLRDLLGFRSRYHADSRLDFTDLRDRVSHLTGMLITSRSELEKINLACETMTQLSYTMNKLNDY